MDPNNISPYSLFSNDSIDPIFSSYTLQSPLTFNPSFFTVDNFSDDPPLPNSATNHHNSLIVPKTEHPFTNLPPLEHFLPLQQPFNFFPFPPPPFESFHRLPQLHHHPTPEKPTSRPPPQTQQPRSKLARQRRQKLSDKTRCLQKLLPWDKKMDQATLLEEAYKYVKFLQAQYSVLQSMPSDTSNNYVGFCGGGGGGGGVFGELEKLNRNQVLQILVNSHVAQTKLYSQGYCVFSIEQLSLLRKLSEKRQQQQQQNMSDHGSSHGFK